MINDKAKIENFQTDARMAFDPISDEREAMELINRLCAAGKEELHATEEEMSELFEAHFGYCVEIDNALSEKFPETFAER